MKTLITRFCYYCKGLFTPNRYLTVTCEKCKNKICGSTGGNPNKTMILPKEGCYLCPDCYTHNAIGEECPCNEDAVKDAFIKLNKAMKVGGRSKFPIFKKGDRILYDGNKLYGRITEDCYREYAEIIFDDSNTNAPYSLIHISQLKLVPESKATFNWFQRLVNFIFRRNK